MPACARADRPHEDTRHRICHGRWWAASRHPALITLHVSFCAPHDPARPCLEAPPCTVNGSPDVANNPLTAGACSVRIPTSKQARPGSPVRQMQRLRVKQKTCLIPAPSSTRRLPGFCSGPPAHARAACAPSRAPAVQLMRCSVCKAIGLPRTPARSSRGLCPHPLLAPISALWFAGPCSRALQTNHTARTSACRRPWP